MIGYNRDKREYGITLCDKITVLSRCCNFPILIILRQSELGKVYCMGKSCINPILEYIKLDRNSAKIIFNEAEKIITNGSIKYTHDKILNYRSILYYGTRKRKRSTTLYKTQKNKPDLLMALNEIKKTKIDLYIELMRKAPKGFEKR